MTDYLHIAKEIAREAGTYQKEKLLDPHTIEWKGEINPVTEVDKACEKMIVEKLQGTFPTHDILAEEGGGMRKHSDYKWIIDPLDGTINYSHGYPLFCVSIALEYKGQIVAGVIYEPNHNELFYAERGSGSFVNDKKISVSPQKILRQSLVSTGFAYNIHQTQKNNFNNFEKMLLSAQAVRRDGVAAVDLCYVACGRYDGFWELNLFPWDVAAGFLIVEEAGGRVTDFMGRPFSIYAKEILATNQNIHPQMVDILGKK